jgi:hypothetical protein
MCVMVSSLSVCVCVVVSRSLGQVGQVFCFFLEQLNSSELSSHAFNLAAFHEGMFVRQSNVKGECKDHDGHSSGKDFHSEVQTLSLTIKAELPEHAEE